MSGESTAHLGVLTVQIHIPASQSLKTKRMALRSLKDRIRSRFNVSIAETDGMDKWQRSEIGVSMIGNDKGYIDRTLREILNLFEGSSDVEVTGEDIQFL